MSDSNHKEHIPPLAEQKAIVARLDEETGKIDRAIAVKRWQIVIDEVATGKVPPGGAGSGKAGGCFTKAKGGF